METNPLPPPPEGPTVETVQRQFPKRRGGLAAVAAMGSVMVGLVLYACANSAPVETAATPTPSVSVAPQPEPELAPPPSQKVLQMKAEQLFEIASTRPSEDYHAAVAQLMMAYSPTGCQFATDLGLARTRRQAQKAIGETMQNLAEPPAGLGDPSFAVARGRVKLAAGPNEPVKEHEAWLVLAMACPEGES